MLYEPGQYNLYFNKKEFVKCLIHGIYSSLVLFFIPMGTIYDTVRSDGKDISDYQSFSMMVQTSLLSVVTAQVWPVGRALVEGETGKGGYLEGREERMESR